MNEGLAEINENGRLTFINPRLAEMLGYSADELLGKSVTTFADEENRQILREQFSGRKTGNFSSYEVRLRRKDGTELFAMVAPMPVFQEGNVFKGAIAVVTDITERVLASQLLEQRVAERTREIATLLDLSHELTSAQGLDHHLNHILEKLKTIVDYRDALIIVIEDGSWRIRACQPECYKKENDLQLSSDEMVRLRELFAPGIIVSLNEREGDKPQSRELKKLSIQIGRFFKDDNLYRSGSPLFKDDRMFGLLVLGFSGLSDFSNNQVKVAEAFANQAAVVIENNMLLEPGPDGCRI